MVHHFGYETGLSRFLNLIIYLFIYLRIISIIITVCAPDCFLQVGNLNKLAEIHTCATHKLTTIERGSEGLLFLGIP